MATFIKNICDFHETRPSDCVGLLKFTKKCATYFRPPIPCKPPTLHTFSVFCVSCKLKYSSNWAKVEKNICNTPNLANSQLLTPQSFTSLCVC